MADHAAFVRAPGDLWTVGRPAHRWQATGVVKRRARSRWCRADIG
ncbi:MAG TPA: hypothetical protein VM347_35440 [Nonomuraea sp.]|nr:hypothetical protein [Nonomuraea sp.]